MSNDQTDTIELESGSRIQVASAMDSGDEGHLSPTTHSHSNSVYETRYQKSLRHYLTREALPKESHYRNLNSIVDGGNVRPTLDDLHNNTFREQQQSTGADPEAQATNLRGKVIKFGWIEGVLMRCLLNIWGVMLFLRVSWMVGQAGLGTSLSHGQSYCCPCPIHHFLVAVIGLLLYFVAMDCAGVFAQNVASDFRLSDGVQYGFFGVFGVFFPAVTGIVAGANLSGDLKDPGSAIPKGTLLAIGITFVTYIVYPFMLAGSVIRDASGHWSWSFVCFWRFPSPYSYAGCSFLPHPLSAIASFLARFCRTTCFLAMRLLALIRYYVLLWHLYRSSPLWAYCEPPILHPPAFPLGSISFAFCSRDIPSRLCLIS
ncbi:Na+/K+/2Cl- cotransporter isoform 1 [Penaeus vannamei]|uniref:Na+/K+/2Cl-cotransporter isoform 1 n=1 Tax=Penaeus vannamei TaxID=6689 RepID=A0A423U3L9_PENVA|nr:Na+/K+/2Cl- cotransporter isoform 1 [Penaeus vannamei]